MKHDPHFYENENLISELVFLVLGAEGRKVGLLFKSKRIINYTG
jgi:hypothetical protein